MSALYFTAYRFMAGDDTTPAKGQQVNIYETDVSVAGIFAKQLILTGGNKYYYDMFPRPLPNVFPIPTLERRTHRTGNNFSQNRFIDTFVYEGLGTKDQTGPMLYDSFWGNLRANQC